MRYLLLALLLLTMMPLATQEATPESTSSTEPDVELQPFTLAEPRISGLRPADWSELQPGAYIREDEQNLTYVLHLSEPDASREELLPPLLDSIEQEALPEAYEAFGGEAFDWEVYRMTYTPEGLDTPLVVLLALAETETALHMILLQSTSDEIEGLRESVFLPALQSYGLPLPELYTRLGLAPLQAVTIAEFDVQSAVPAEWQEVNPGSFVRARFQGDITTLIIQTSPDLDAGAFGNLLLERLGLGVALPEAGETLEAESLTWTLYEIDVASQGQPLIFQVALAEDDAYTYLVVLLSTQEEAAELRETVLLPLLQATNRAEGVPDS